MLYRVGLHHENGASSMVSLDVRPARMVVGELAASAADVVAHRANVRRTERPGAPPGMRARGGRQAFS
jgi:hypothetical protein